MKKSLFIFCFSLSIGCTQPQQDAKVLPGAYQLEEYMGLVEGKNVGLVINHTSMIGDQLLLDTLLKLQINIHKVFTPEHGLKGTASNGEIIEYDSKNEVYELISLYGKNKKPTDDQMQGLDVILFDLQDVGARFYTYISTMQYMMEACVKNEIQLIILDRPNPNGSYVDGPILDTTLSSNVGLIPIPIVYGMTNGELAQMINNEGWLTNGKKCDLSIIKIKNWKHTDRYSLPVKPSPNLPNDLSIALYPNLCLFEGTVMSVGRGTEFPFQQIGHPDWPEQVHSFIPIANEGAKWPPYENQECFGVSWIDSTPEYSFTLRPLIEAYQKMDTVNFFNGFFKRLVGTSELQKQIESGMTEEDIKATWQEDLDSYKEKRERYLLYD